MNENHLFNKMLELPIFKPLIYSACKQPEQFVEDYIYKIHSFIKLYIKNLRIILKDFRLFCNVLF